jgi:outer membrane protein assembly factor BamB
MLRKLARVVLFLFVALAVAAGVLYAVGLRIVYDGGAGVHFAFPKSAEERAAAIEKHREAQRAQAPEPSPAPVLVQPEPAAAVPAASDAAEKPRNATPRTSAHWTSFRGPDRDGHYRQQPVRTDWGPVLTPLWKQPVGGGYASFVIADGRAFTIEQRAERELAAAYDLATGRELWTTAWAALFQESMGGDGPRATPTWQDGRLYVLGATGEFRALDAATGRTFWRTNILADARAENVQWGMAAAPLVVDDMVVVLPGGANGQSVVAYDRQSGQRVWSALDDRASYSSPMLVTLAGVRQIVAFTATRLVGLSPVNGALLWEFPWKTANEVNASQPLIVGTDRVFISTGYGADAAMLQLAAAADGQMTVRELWRTNRMNNVFTSSVLHDGYIYGLDESILTCLDAATGALKWKGGRYGYGQVMLVSGHLIVLTEQGELALVRADPTSHQEITRFTAIEGKTWNHPAMSDGILLIRNIEEMAAFDLAQGIK